MDHTSQGKVLEPPSTSDLPRFRSFMTLNPAMLCNSSASGVGPPSNHGIGCISCDEELGYTGSAKDTLTDDIIERQQEWRRLAQLTWWDWMSCFTYAAVGLLLWMRLAIIQEACPDHPWRMEAALLLGQ